MQLGRHLRQLWRLRIGLVVSVMLASLAALGSVGKIGLFPPSVKPRTLEMAAASTRALVDSPKSAVLDLTVNTYHFQAMTNRGVLVGNIMASAPVRQYIARRAGVRAELLQVAAPVTPDFPRQLASSGTKATSDILDSPNQYRVSITANPTVPVVDVYAQAPTARLAEQLADGTVAGMQDYLRDLAAAQRVPLANQVRLEQLGAAKGGVLNEGVGVKVAVLAFILVLAASCATVMWLARVRQGWAMEAMQEPTRAARAGV